VRLADDVGRYDQEVGYTQGLAFIVAALLLNVGSPGLRGPSLRYITQCAIYTDSSFSIPSYLLHVPPNHI
jgi:hypothetical protein